MTLHIDSEYLISLVKAKPAIWDKSSALYKDKSVTKEAWRKIFRKLDSDYDLRSEEDQKEFGKDVIKKWWNIRDTYVRSCRRIRTYKVTGQGHKIKKYVYADQLQFLSSDKQDREEQDETELEYTTEYLQLDSDNEDMITANEDESHSTSRKDESHSTSRKDESHLTSRIYESHSTSRKDESHSTSRKYESHSTSRKDQSHSPPVKKKKCEHFHSRRAVSVGSNRKRHLCFFKGIIPSLQHFDEDETVEFQMGVLQLISAIKRRRHANQDENYVEVNWLTTEGDICQETKCESFSDTELDPL